MSMLEREFAVGDHPEVAVTVSSSSVSVAEGDAGTITLEAEGSESGLEGLMVAQIGDVVTIADSIPSLMQEFKRVVSGQLRNEAIVVQLGS